MIQKTSFRKATQNDSAAIWEILRGAIKRRKEDGSDQWQSGYPNLGSIKVDIAKEYDFVLEQENSIIGYCAIIKNDEPAYNNIEGKWLSNEDFYVVHRVAIAEEFLNKGWAKRIFIEIEKLAILHKIPSIKVDTNFDNIGMLKILEKLNYTFCGTVIMNGSPRKAFEKLLNK